MNYRNLIGQDQKISEIGFGAWGIGGVTPGATSYGVTDDAVSRGALKSAYDAGINYFDTSNMYGLGRSESLIGKTLSSVRNHILIGTKAGLVDYNQPGNYEASELISSLESSLIRLQTDYIDFFYLHNLPIDEGFDGDYLNVFFAELKKSGKIRFAGLSVRSPEEALLVLEKIDVDVVQTNFNLMDYRVIDLDLLKQAVQANVSIIARSPLAAGFLSGEIRADTVFDKQDHRSRFNKDLVSVWLDMVDRFQSSLDHIEGDSLSLLALRFCLSFSGIVSVIPGILTPDQVLENVKSSQKGKLSQQKLDQLEEIYRYGEQQIIKKIELNKNKLIEGKVE